MVIEAGARAMERLSVDPRQLVRFGLVGLAANAIGFLLYTGLTYLGLSPKTTVGVLYPVGALIGFVGNKRLTFGHRGAWLSSGWRYLLVQAVGMCINLLMLWLFADRLGIRHHWVQLAAIVVVAVYLFMTMRWFVFAQRAEDS